MSQGAEALQHIATSLFLLRFRAERQAMKGQAEQVAQGNSHSPNVRSKPLLPCCFDLPLQQLGRPKPHCRSRAAKAHRGQGPHLCDVAQIAQANAKAIAG